MPGPNFVLDKGLIPTTATGEFLCVTQSTTNKEQCTLAASLGAQVIGVTQGIVATADAGKQVVDVRIIGISRVVAGAALTIGTRVRTSATGKAVALAAATANQNQLGVVLTPAAADGDHVDVLLTIGTQVTVP